MMTLVSHMADRLMMLFPMHVRVGTQLQLSMR